MSDNKTPTQTPIQKPIKLNNLLEDKELKLTIPPYQRPYKWSKKNVLQLLEDIFGYVLIQNKDYRIGSIILHEDESKVNNIVDGQQRLTTISLLLKILDNKFEGLLLNQKYKHDISKNNIIYNYRIINQWANTKFPSDSDKIDFKNKILNKCEFILFTVYLQEEAFQLFDSQNARGKALEPYDLLKAFHLREMEFDSEDERIKCVERWEKSIDEKTLKPILGNHLFKIRKWSKNEWKYNFTRDEIDEFKGISLYKKQVYPYESTMRMLDGFVENAQNDKFLRNLQIAQSFPFSITMPIINGKRFFEYVDFYILQREKLFDLNKEDRIIGECKDFVEFYEKYCCNYNGAGRSGDEKVRNLYENILMVFIDKFGFIEDFKSYYEAFYKMVYIIRCNKKRITIETILNSDAKKILSEINDSVSPDNLKNYQYRTYQLETNDFVKGIGNTVSLITGFEDKLRKLIEEKSYKNLKLDNGFLDIPYTFNGEQYFIKVQDFKWYGFRTNYIDEKNEELVHKIRDFNLTPNSSWFGYKTITNPKNQITEIASDILNWLSVFNEKTK